MAPGPEKTASCRRGGPRMLTGRVRFGPPTTTG